MQNFLFFSPLFLRLCQIVIDISSFNYNLSVQPVATEYPKALGLCVQCICSAHLLALVQVFI